MGQEIPSFADRGVRTDGGRARGIRAQLTLGPCWNIRQGTWGISNNQEIFTAQIQALYRHTPMVLAVNIINSGLVALVLASYLEQTRWWIFFGLVVTLTAARAIGWRYYRRHRRHADLATRWAIIATAGSGLSGLLWGASGILLLPDNIVEQTFLAFVIGGMCAGGAPLFPCPTTSLPSWPTRIFPCCR